MKKGLHFWLRELLLSNHKVDFCYVVNYVIDGDTFVLSSGEKVRLIGIDSPERGADLYNEAKSELEELVLDECVRLESDVSEVDKYNRLLRYVYFHDYFINLIMVESGYARAVRYPPDTEYAKLFKQAELKAMQKGLGIWKPESSGANCRAKRWYHQLKERITA